MNPQISLSYAPATLADFLTALAALRGHDASIAIEPPNVAPTAFQPPARVETAEPMPEPSDALETRYLNLTSAKRMRMTADEISRWGGDREGCAGERLAALETETPEDERGATYEPGALPDAEDISADDY